MLVRDVGHFVLNGITKSLKRQVGGDTVLSVVPMAYTGSGGGSVGGDCRRNLVGRSLDRVWRSRERKRGIDFYLLCLTMKASGYLARVSARQLPPLLMGE